RREAGGIAFHGGDYQIGYLFTTIVPRAAGRQLWSKVLAEKARDMPARRRQGVVQRRRNEHLDDRLSAPPELARLTVCAVHVIKTWRKNDARGVMILRFVPGQCRKARQLGECHIDAQRTRSATPVLHARKKGGIERVRLNELGIEQPGIDIRGDRRRPNMAAA